MYHRRGCLRPIAFLLAATLAGVGCARLKTAGQPLPAEFQITQSLAILIEANKAATETAIQLNKALVIDDSTAAQILGYTVTVAQASKTALVIMNSNATTAQKTAQVQAAFARVTATAAVQQYVSAHQNDSAARAVVAALDAVQMLVESLVKGVNA
jgi:hypothetical protein